VLRGDERDWKDDRDAVRRRDSDLGEKGGKVIQVFISGFTDTYLAQRVTATPLNTIVTNL
jgi:hypothetical protein